MPKILVHFFTLLALMTGGFYALVRHLETSGVFFPSRQMAVNPSVLGFAWEDVYFKTADHLAINGWFFKNPRAKSTVIFAHGNAGNMSGRLFKVKFFHDLGLNVFIFDYRGYGKSEGRPSEKGIYLDAQGAWDYLASRGDVDMQNTVLWGESLGGAVVIDLAARHKPASLLVIEKSFTNARDMARIHYPFVPLFFLSLKFDSLSKIAQIKVPKLFIQSPSDEVVPYANSRKLFEAAPGPKEELKIRGGHNDAFFMTDPSAAREFARILKDRNLI